MAMTGGSGPGGLSSDINVTPLIDVLLVLLIIFMVIVPVVPKGLDALVPQPPKDKTPQPPDPRTIVVSVLHTNGSQVAYKINQDDVAKGDLLAKLTSIYANRAERIMFIKGDDDVNFAQVADVIDIGHSAGVDHVGLMTPKILQEIRTVAPHYRGAYALVVSCVTEASLQPVEMESALDPQEIWLDRESPTASSRAETPGAKTWRRLEGEG